MKKLSMAEKELLWKAKDKKLEDELFPIFGDISYKKLSPEQFVAILVEHRVQLSDIFHELEKEFPSLAGK
jgi:hypothetical protein